MEADLARFYTVELADHWRRGPDGRRLLSLRRLRTLVTQLPPESAVASIGREGDPHWSLEAILLDVMRMALTSTEKEPAEPHPSRVRAERRGRGETNKANAEKLVKARARAAARRRDIEEGRIT